jgi:hypothetical protein
MKTLKQSPKSSQKPCFVPRLTHQEANSHWLRTQHDSKTTYLSNFMLVATFLTSNVRSFSYDEFLREMLKFENSGTPAQIRQTFEAWATHLIGKQKLEEIHGTYDQPIYLVL